MFIETICPLALEVFDATGLKFWNLTISNESAGTRRVFKLMLLVFQLSCVLNRLVLSIIVK
jgi:hypothetical protein